MRRYEVAYLSKTGDVREFNRPAPAISAFESAFATLGRGAILNTENGLTAVEDLMPGDRVETVDNGFQTLNWMGRMTIIPDFSGQYPMMGKLTRFTDNSFGLGRPMPDLVLGPRARLGQGTAAAYRLIRERVPFLERDAIMYPYMEAVHDLVVSGELTGAVEAALA